MDDKTALGDTLSAGSWLFFDHGSVMFHLWSNEVDKASIFKQEIIVISDENTAFPVMSPVETVSCAGPTPFLYSGITNSGGGGGGAGAFWWTISRQPVLSLRFDYFLPHPDPVACEPAPFAMALER